MKSPSPDPSGYQRGTPIMPPAHPSVFPTIEGYSRERPGPVQTAYPAAAGTGLRDSLCRSSWVCLPDRGDQLGLKGSQWICRKSRQ